MSWVGADALAGGHLVRWSLFCWVGLVLYGLLSVADLKLTTALLRAGGGAYESNPVAAACLERHGWRGLAYYKGAGVVAFAGALILLMRHRPKVAAAVVTFGCAVLVAVTTYSHDLLLETHRENEQTGGAFFKSELVASLPADSGLGLTDDCWASSR
jgi:hypothetical protein